MAITILPDETDTDLIIDPDAVLSSAVTFQSFQTVSRGYQQVCQLGGVVEHSQLPPRKDLQLSWVPPHLETVPYATCILRSKGTNHASNTIILRYYCQTVVWGRGASSSAVRKAVIAPLSVSGRRGAKRSERSEDVTPAARDPSAIPRAPSSSPVLAGLKRPTKSVMADFLMLTSSSQ